MSNRIPLVVSVSLLLAACSSTTPTPESDASAATSDGGGGVGPQCMVTPRGCPYYRCNCTNGETHRTAGDRTNEAGCMTGEEACLVVCRLMNSDLAPPTTCEKVVEYDAAVADAAPVIDPGFPGGECVRGPGCYPYSCRCKDGTNLLDHQESCTAGRCPTLEVACTNACKGNAGWAGTGK